MTHIEIERRFLVAPITKPLPYITNWKSIVHYYVECSEGTRRISFSETEDIIEYRECFKTKSPDHSFASIERERVITLEEYHKFLGEEKIIGEIGKLRWTWEENGLTWEADEFYGSNLVILEVELESEDQPYTLPKDIEIIREITGEEQYSNFWMATHVGN